MSNKIQVFAGSISLAALLIYTLIHTGGLLARYIQPVWGGYIAAFGIELAIVSLSLRIGQLKRSKQDTRFFLFVLVSVVVVSAIANIAEGFNTNQNAIMTIDNIRNLDPIQALIGLTATGLISLIVLALSEIIGTDVQAVVKEQRKTEQKKPKSDTTTEQLTLIRAENAEQRRTQLTDILRTEPDTPLVTIAQQLDISRSTLYTDLNKLTEQGIIHRNGDGIKVLEVAQQ